MFSIGPAPRRKQQGLALLFLLALIGLVGGFLIINAMNRSGAELSQARDRKTQAALDKAKQALLAYAAGDYLTSGGMNLHNPNKGVPGYLPCPEQTASAFLPEGSEPGNCGAVGVSAIGRLPWFSLGLEPPRDSSGECLWYAVSGTYKSNPNGVNVANPPSSFSNMMNWDTPGLFDVFASDGATLLAGGVPSTRAVAVIFAPGAPTLAAQNRLGPGGPICGGNYTASNYLESANGINNSMVSAVANNATSFIAGQASNTFNDRLVYITRDELWAAIKKRPDFQMKLNTLTQKVAQCVASYGTHNSSGGNKSIPWTTALALAEYSYDSSYRDVSNGRSGRVPYRVNVSDGTTTNDLVSPSDLFNTASYCYPGTLDDRDLNWYSNWKDHFFYALSNRFRPGSGSFSCGSASCVTVSGSGTFFAGIVIFAGERLSGQARNTNADRANITNYLEGTNTNSNASGNGIYQSGPASATFNDLLYCILPNLSVVPCP